ncbi:MAG: hypothetical protein M3069_24655 [Chloroflexota bacterium]|nr:hypothetical protein [Chloroflexota bacterium]
MTARANGEQFAPGNRLQPTGQAFGEVALYVQHHVGRILETLAGEFLDVTATIIRQVPDCTVSSNLAYRDNAEAN